MKKTLYDKFKEDPFKMFKDMDALEQLLDGMKSAAFKILRENGAYKSKGISARIINREFIKLDPEKAASILEDLGYDLLDVCSVKLTEDSIKEKLGSVKGNKLISELKTAGAIKKFTTEFMRVSVK